MPRLGPSRSGLSSGTLAPSQDRSTPVDDVDAGNLPAAGRALRARRLRRTGAALVGTGLAVALAVSCGTAATPRKAPAATSSSASPPPSPTPPPPPPPVWPLTGQPATGPVDRPALVVKIENSVDARPQTGLGAADLVWEQLVEGGITRYVAVYQSQVPAEIGPVRSVRPMDPAIAGPLHGLFAFSGGQQQYVDAIAAAGLQVLSNDAGAGGFYRVNSRVAPHNVYASPQQLLDQADPAHKAAPPAQFAFPPAGQQPTALTAGTPAAGIQITMSAGDHPQWAYDAASGTWLRGEDGAPAVQADGSQLRATNVVVLRVDVVTTGAVDPAGTHVPETQLVGTGQALVATGGRTVTATWSKTSIADLLHLTGADGATVTLAPGSTWIELVPNGTGAVAAG
jgi:hypothetical protein